jgi:CheY-like chemotaxis protein/anti-sigma regulatory factor (Ser/Thr protein kinase)
MTTVLVVDDSAMDRRLAGSLLKRAGYASFFANNGREALEMVAETTPDVVLTDLQMPEMDGLELVEAIRSRYPVVPVILMTAHGSEEIAVRALQKGAASYVPKRRLAQALVTTIANVLDIARSAEPEQQVLAFRVYTESRFELDNDVTRVTPLVGFLEGSLRRSMDETALLQVGVALREAVVNAMYHGNLEVSSSLREGDDRAFQALIAERQKQLPYAARRVHVTARTTRDDVTYVVTDEGPGFDPSSLPDPTDPAQLEKEHGRGLLLIRTFMDEVSHNARGNEITMVKRFASAAAEID